MLQPERPDKCVNAPVRSFKLKCASQISQATGRTELLGFFNPRFADAGLEHDYMVERFKSSCKLVVAFFGATKAI
jgi:hypothetical protein